LEQAVLFGASAKVKKKEKKKKKKLPLTHFI
jgi:hypothetical protein